MNIEYRGQNRPEAIDLGVVAGDLGENDKEARKEDSKSKRSRKGICREIDCLERIYIFCRDHRLELFWEPSDLRQKWSHGMVKGDAVCERLDFRKWKSHCFR